MSARYFTVAFLLFGFAFAASAQLAGPAEDAAITYLERNWNRHDLASQADVAELVITDAVESRHGGATSVHLRQGIDGISVIDGQMVLAVDDNGHVFHAAGRLTPDLASRTVHSGDGVGPAAAANTIASEAGFPAPVPFQVAEPGVGATQRTVLTDGGGHSHQPVIAELVYIVDDAGNLRLAWDATVTLHGDDGQWRGLVDAGSGNILRLDDVLIYDHFGESAEAPMIVKRERSTPGMLPQPSAQPSTRTGECYTVVEWPQMDPFHTDPAWPADTRTEVCDPFDPVASPDGWHDDNGDGTPDYTITRGNNAHAYADWTSSIPPEPDGGAELHFDFPIDYTAEPETYVDASTTNLFYWNNLFHDVMVHYGFDEAHWNFQEHNYTGDGLGGDYVNAEAQDNNEVSCNNANFSRTVDGENPRMQMFLGCNHTPKMDGDLDNHVIIHEYGHGVSIRMTGGGSTPSCLSNSEHGGEGWSDWYGLMLTQDETADDYGRDQSLGVGVFLFHDANPNGIRPRPYNTDFSVNEFTYGMLAGQAIPHGVGFVWATILWEVTWDLIDEYGYNQDITAVDDLTGNIIMMNLVTEAFNMTPCSPGFVDQRDAIFAAVDVVYGDEPTTWRDDLKQVLWGGFARRGLGFLADQGSPNSTGDETEDFTVPSEIAPDAIVDLAAEPGSNFVTLTWTAPDDDDSDVLNYHVRYATSPILNETDWDNATPVPAAEDMVPQDPGETEELIVTNLEFNTEYHFAVRSDDGLNTSEISNSAEATTSGAPTADISPESFTFEVEADGSDTQELMMGNTGEGDLLWSILEAEGENGLLPNEVWSDDFEDYDVGSEIAGQGGWENWDNSPAAAALVSDAQANSGSNSLDILEGADVVRQFDEFEINSGRWVITAWQYIPDDFDGTSMFIMLNTYAPSSVNNWSTQVEFSSATGMVQNCAFCSSGGELPLITGEWVEIRVEIDLDEDTQTFYYGGEELYSGTWTDEVSGGGELTFDTIDLFANSASSVYYDDLSVAEVVGCEAPTDVSWLSLSADSGTTAAGTTESVDVMVDASTVEPDNEYEGVLCVTTNDPTASSLEIPVALSVGTIGTEDDLAFEGTHRLSPVAPNPINGSAARTTLEVAEAQDVRIELFDVRGRRVATPFEGALAARTAQEIALDGNALAPGVYVLRISGETFAETRRVTVAR